MGNTITKDGALASLGRIESALKLRYMGIGFVWAWLYCTYATSAVFPDRRGQSINADESWLASAIAVVAVFLIGGVLLSRISCRQGGLRIAAPVLLSAGTVVSALGSVAAPLAWAGGILTGIGYALLSLLWAQALMALDVEELEVAVPLSALVMVPCMVVFPALDGVAGVAAAALLPLASGTLLALCVSDGNAREAAVGPGAPVGEPAGKTVPVSDADAARRLEITRPWGIYLLRVALVLVVLYLAVGWQAAHADVSDGLHALVGVDVAMLVASLASVVLCVAIVFFSKKVGFSGLFRWAVPCSVVALVLQGVPGLWAGFVGNAISDTLDSLVQVLVYLFAVTLAKRGKAPAALSAGVLNGAVQLGVLAGNLAGGFWAAGGVVASSPVVAALICLVALSGIAAPQSEPADEQTALPVGPDALERSLMEGCRRLRGKCGLSDRETEIAFLIARGYSRPYIREKLFISKNTVATHIRHIYGKLGIHSKEELIDLVEEAARER